MSFGSGFIIGQMLGNGNSHYQKHALEQDNYEPKRKNDELVRKMRILEYRLDRAKRALCEISELSLQDNVDTSRFYDIAHYVIIELNKEN